MSISLRKKISILDYGVGNISSLKGSLERMGYKVITINNRKDLANQKVIFLPGVGSFAYAMDNLRKTGIDKDLKSFYQDNSKIVIGICLGMQILFDYSEEGSSNGLGIIPGNVCRFDNKECHVGWNIVEPKTNSILEERAGYYFNHSYFASCHKKFVIGTSFYQKEIPVIVNSKNFYGFQFHPEKSQNAGIHILKKIIGD